MSAIVRIALLGGGVYFAFNRGWLDEPLAALGFQQSARSSGDPVTPEQPADVDPVQEPSPVVVYGSGGSWEPLLRLIRKSEAAGNYNAVWGGIATVDGPPQALTTMTIGEVLAWQDSIDAKYASEAAGGYQMLEDTLRGYYRGAGLSASDLFSPANQDRIAVYLLESKRRMDRWKNGTITLDQAVLGVAREWAAFPVPYAMQGHSRYVQAGQSYYAGDGLNAAYVPLSTVKDALRDVKGN